MMKKITLLFLFLLTVTFGYSQDLLLGFEIGESGTLGDVFGEMANPTVVTGTGTNTTQVLEIVGNPDTVGPPPAQPWQGTNYSLSSAVDLTSTSTMTIDVKSATPITFLVKVNTGATEAAAEVTHNGDGTWQTLPFTFDTALDGKAAFTDGVYSNFVIHAYWQAGETSFFPGGTPIAISARTFYVDNIKGPEATPDPCTNGVQDNGETGVDCGGSCVPCAAPPTVAAPTPPARDPGDVISIYSDAYTDITIDVFDFGLCDGGTPDQAAAEVMIAGNPTINYLGSGCQGIDFQLNRIDASTFNNLHFDFYTDETSLIGKVFNIKLVDWAGNPTEAGSTGLEVNFNDGTSPGITTGSWISVDVDITAIGGMVGGNLTRSDVAQIHITSNLPNAWYDNLYLYNTVPTCDDGIQNQGETGIDCGGPCASCGTCSDGIQNGGETQIDCGGPNCAPCTGPPTVAAPTPPARPTADVISIYSDAYTDTTIDVFDFGLCDGGTPDQAAAEVMIAGNPTINYLGSGCQGIDMQLNRIDASTFTNLHVDFYTDDAIIGAVFNLKLVDWAGNPTEAGSTGLELNFNGGTNPALVAGQWVSLDFDLTAINAPTVIGNLTRSDVAQIHITSNLPNAWYDNLYLHKGTVLGTEDKELPSFKVYPNPTQDSWTVKTRNQQMSSIRVFDILGKQVLTLSPNTNETKIDGTSLKAGIYFAQIETATGINSVKLVKQ